MKLRLTLFAALAAAALFAASPAPLRAGPNTVRLLADRKRVVHTNLIALVKCVAQSGVKNMILVVVLRVPGRLMVVIEERVGIVGNKCGLIIAQGDADTGTRLISPNAIAGCGMRHAVEVVIVKSTHSCLNVPPFRWSGGDGRLRLNTCRAERDETDGGYDSIHIFLICSTTQEAVQQ